MADLSQNKTPIPSQAPPALPSNQPPTGQTPPDQPKRPRKFTFPPMQQGEKKPITPKQEEMKKELSELGISPKGGSKKTKILMAILGVLFFVATLPAAVYLVKQRQEIRKEAADNPNCENISRTCESEFGSGWNPVPGECWYCETGENKTCTCKCHCTNGTDHWWIDSGESCADSETSCPPSGGGSCTSEQCAAAGDGPGNQGGISSMMCACSDFECTDTGGGCSYRCDNNCFNPGGTPGCDWNPDNYESYGLAEPAFCYNRQIDYYNDGGQLSGYKLCHRSWFGDQCYPTEPDPSELVCDNACDPDNDLCPDPLACTWVDIYAGNRCRNPECSEENSCVCPEETPAPTPIYASCNEVCVQDNVFCSDPWECLQVGNILRCRNPDCREEDDCVCPSIDPICYDTIITGKNGQEINPETLSLGDEGYILVEGELGGAQESFDKAKAKIYYRQQGESDWQSLPSSLWCRSPGYASGLYCESTASEVTDTGERLSIPFTFPQIPITTDVEIKVEAFVHHPISGWK